MSRPNQSIAGLTVSLPAQEPLDTWSLASCFQHWPSLVVLGVILAYSPLPGGPFFGPPAARCAHPIPVSGQRCAVCSSCLSLAACSPLTACFWCSAGCRGCEKSCGLFSPCVAVCLSLEDFSSPALQVPSFPLLPVGTLCLCYAWWVIVSCEGAGDYPATPEQALGRPASLLAETCHGGFLFCFALFVCLPGGGRGGR